MSRWREDLISDRSDRVSNLLSTPVNRDHLSHSLSSNFTNERKKKWLELSLKRTSPSVAYNSPVPCEVQVSGHWKEAPLLNRASSLRQQSYPQCYDKTDYKAVIAKNKRFDLHCKLITGASFSLPNGKSFNSFLLGTRYNCDRYIDSSAVKTHGLYIPRNKNGVAFIHPNKLKEFTDAFSKDSKARKNSYCDALTTDETLGFSAPKSKKDHARRQQEEKRITESTASPSHEAVQMTEVTKEEVEGNFISLEAQKLAGEILLESQLSQTSLNEQDGYDSKQVEQEANELAQVNQDDQEIELSEMKMEEQSDNDGEQVGEKNDQNDHNPEARKSSTSADMSGADLTAVRRSVVQGETSDDPVLISRSSSIVVDMSNLNVNEDDSFC